MVKRHFIAFAAALGLAAHLPGSDRTGGRQAAGQPAKWAMRALLLDLRRRGLKRFSAFYPTSTRGRCCGIHVQRSSRRIPTWSWSARTAIAGVQRVSRARFTTPPRQARVLLGNEGEAAPLVRNVEALDASRRLPVSSRLGVSGGNLPALAGDALQRVDLRVVQAFSFEGRSDPRSLAVLARARRFFGLRDLHELPANAGYEHAYDLTHQLARALRLAGRPDRAAVRAVLQRVRDYDGLLGRFARPFSPASHEAPYPAHAFMGRFSAAGAVVPLASGAAPRARAIRAAGAGAVQP